MAGAIALGVGTMIAAGIFVLSGLAVNNVGAMAIVSFLIAAIVASFTAFAMPNSRLSILLTSERNPPSAWYCSS